jgi:hypothetical protein
MPKPSDEELKSAIEKAVEMREQDADPFYLAKCLLSHNFRMKHMEEVLKIADRYVNMGMSERELTRLIRAIAIAKDIDSYTSSQEQERFGLE